MFSLYMKHGLTILVFLCAISCAAANREGGIFSHSAVSIWGSDAGTIPSPDRKKAIVISRRQSPESDPTRSVSVRANGREYTTEIGEWVNAEAAWSPDSAAFFVTYSDGGNVGIYHVKIVYVESTRLRIVEPVPNGDKLFVPICDGQASTPNVGAINWVGNDASRLLIAVEVPPHSLCASMGTFKAFEIKVADGTVLAKYGQLQAKKLFRHALGVELLGADDVCVQKPQECAQPGFEIPKSKTQH